MTTNSGSLLYYAWAMRDDTILRAAASRSVRPAKLGDLNPVIETKGGTATDPDKIGNPDLVPERATALELGVEHYLAGKRGLVGINFFHRDITDLVEKQTLEMADGRFAQQPINAGDGKLWGAELEYQQPLDFITNGLMLSANYSRLYSELKDSRTSETRDIKDQPPYVYNLGLDWSPKQGPLLAGLAYNVIPELTSDAPKDDGTSREIKTESAKRLLDAYLGWRVMPRWQLRVSGHNLLAESKDRDQTTFKEDGSFSARETRIEQPERLVSLSLEGRW